MLDSLIYVGIILLILSQIAEKITTFIRNYIRVVTNSMEQDKPESRFRKLVVYVLRGLAQLDDISDLAKSKIRAVSTDEKPKIEFAITKLSVLIGFAVALSFKANLLELFAAKNLMPHETLGWDSVSFNSGAWRIIVVILYHIAGCLITGLLLTFGSKFFHDLLEILYEVKRLRQKIADEYTYRSPSIEILDRRVAAPFEEPVKLVLERHRDRLIHKFPDIVSIARVFDNQGNALLEIRTKQEDVSALNSYVYDYLEGDQIKQLSKHLVVLIGGAKPIKALNDSTIWVGDWIFNNATIDNQGTLGFFANQRGKTVLVTCYHVLKTEHHPWEGLGNTDNDLNTVYGKFLNNGSFQFTGIIRDGVINDWMDVAVVELKEGLKYVNQDASFGAFRIKSTSNIPINGRVKVNGAKSDPAFGIVTSIENCVKIDYGTQIRSMYDLLCLKPIDSTVSLTQKGDSGSVILDEDNNVVGMIVAGDGELSYAIPINRIMEAFGLS